MHSLGRMPEGLGQVRFALGPHAFKLIAENAPDIILLTPEMPGLSGWGLPPGFTNSRRHAPIIFITGHNDDEHELAGSLEAGAVDFVANRPSRRWLQARVKGPPASPSSPPMPRATAPTPTP